MRTFILGSILGVALAGPSVAADKPVYKTLPPAASAWNWTGCYAGGHAGRLQVAQKDWINWTPGGAFYGESLGGHETNSWFGGVQAGCDYQFAAGLVLGLQGDYAFADAEGRHDSAHEFGVAYHSHTKSLSTVTGRLGYGWDRFLGYIKGGAAWERDGYAASTIVLGTVYTADVTRTGWTAGVGGEYAFTNILSGFVEYDYYDFGSRVIALTPLLAGLPTALVDIKDTKSVVRVGLNLRFGYAAPVIAKR